MNLLRRVLALFRIKSDRLLERAEDPRESLDDAYRRQLELLARVRRGLVEVATARKRVELQGTEFAQTRARLEEQARQALAAGREDLARAALTRRATVDAQLGDLSAQHAKLVDDEAGLVEAASRFQAKVDAFRLQKETIKATYTAADAQVQVRESLAGVSTEMNDLGQAIARAQDRTAQLQARAGAIDELLDSGALDDLSQPTDRIQAELDRISIDSGVDRDLERLRRELPAGSAGAIEGPKSANPS